MRFKQAYPMISVVVTYIDKIMHKTFYMTLHLDKIKNFKKVFTLQKEHYLLFGN